MSTAPETASAETRRRFRPARDDLARFEARHFLWQLDGKVATLTLNRPERKNPLTFESYAELRDTFRDLVYANGIKSVVITGAGGNFCSGGDVHEIIGPLVELQRKGDMQGLLAFTRMTGDLVKAMRACPQPIVAAIDGVCAGAGAILAMASDLRYGTARSKTAFLFVRVGLAGADMGACNMLPRIVGAGRAADLLYTGRTMDGTEAERWGFFNKLCEPDAVLSEALALARGLADGPTFAHAMTKRCLHQEWSMGIDEAIEAEAQAQPFACRPRTTSALSRRSSPSRSPPFRATDLREMHRIDDGLASFHAHSAREKRVVSAVR
jgi:enoyl-CoA hydratase/carnithine racemase